MNQAQDQVKVMYIGNGAPDPQRAQETTKLIVDLVTKASEEGRDDSMAANALLGAFITLVMNTPAFDKQKAVTAGATALMKAFLQHQKAPQERPDVMARAYFLMDTVSALIEGSPVECGLMALVNLYRHLLLEHPDSMAEGLQHCRAIATELDAVMAAAMPSTAKH